MLKIIISTLMLLAFQTSLHAGTKPTLENTTKLYVATFNRAPDAAGLEYWINSGLSLEGIAQSFFEQPETQLAYPASSTNTEFVEAVYANLFNREPEAAGLEYWVAELDTGRIAQSVFIQAVINGAQNTAEFGNDATILTNKTTVGLEFADAGLDDVELAIAIMSGITDDYSTVDTALNFLVKELACEINSNYTPENSVVYKSSSPIATVIVLHGKTASPESSWMINLAAGLSAMEYDVILPYMPWSNTDWDASVCESYNYISTLIRTEQAKGKEVILVGHSLAGGVVSGYSALSETTKPTATVILAPGHFVSPDISNDEIDKANEMIANGEGDTYTDFLTRTLDGDVTINSTPSIYLSYHTTTNIVGTELFPNMNVTIPVVQTQTEVLWLAGIDDPLTNVAKIRGLIDLVENDSKYIYDEIEGDHHTLMDNVTEPLDTWYKNLSN